MLFLTSQKLILASRQGYFLDIKQIDTICFQIFLDDYTPVLPINSPLEAHKGGGGETAKDREEIRDLLSRFQEFRELLL